MYKYNKVPRKAHFCEGIYTQLLVCEGEIPYAYAEKRYSVNESLAR